MKLKVIGTGSKGNAYILENDKEALLIECGVHISEIKKALNFNLRKAVGCIVTHEHGDHSRSVVDVMKLAIPVFATKGTFFELGINHSSYVRAIPLIVHETIKLGNFTIKSFDVKHDAKEPVGFIISHPECGRVLFLTDTCYCEYTFPKLNNIIIEANFSKAIIDSKFGPESGKEFLRNRILRNHFSLEHCKNLLSVNDLSQVNNIVLIHLSDSNSNEVEFQQEVYELTRKNVSVAVNNMEIDFNQTPF